MTGLYLNHRSLAGCPHAGKAAAAPPPCDFSSLNGEKSVFLVDSGFWIIRKSTFSSAQTNQVV